MFKEILSNPEIDIRTNDLKIMRKAAIEVPKILSKTIRLKNLDEVLSGKTETTKQFNEIIPNAPYLVRRPYAKKPVGVVRFNKCVENKHEYICYVKDYLCFANEVKKYNDELMQMFSVVYRSWESWHEPDTDDEYIKNAEIRKAVIEIAKNGFKVGLNEEHEYEISKNDAAIIELYQSRTNWYEEGLEIRKGDLCSTTQFFDTPQGRGLWKGLKNGTYTTYSMEGSWSN